MQLPVYISLSGLPLEGALKGVVCDTLSAQPDTRRGTAGAAPWAQDKAGAAPRAQGKAGAAPWAQGTPARDALFVEMLIDEK